MRFEFFIKVFDNIVYAQNFLNKGEMLFRPATYFKEREDIRQDKNEGILVENIHKRLPEGCKKLILRGAKGGKTFIVDLERFKNENPDFNNANDLTFHFKYISDFKIYCMAYINDSMPNLSSIFNRLREYGNYAVLIGDCKGFIEQVKKALKDYEYRFVSYSDVTVEKSPFDKAKNFSDESEFRFVTTDDLKNNYLYIGTVNGVISNIDELEELLKKFY